MKRKFPEFTAKHHGDIRSRKPGCARSTRERRDGINTRSYRRIPNRRSHHVAQCHSMLRKENNMITLSTRGESVFKRRQRRTWTFHPLSTRIPRNPGLSELMQGVDAASHIKRRPPDARPQRKMKIDPVHSKATRSHAWRPTPGCTADVRTSACMPVGKARRDTFTENWNDQNRCAVCLPLQKQEFLIHPPEMGGVRVRPVDR